MLLEYFLHTAQCQHHTHSPINRFATQLMQIYIYIYKRPFEMTQVKIYGEMLNLSLPLHIRDYTE